jgi:hypothetical protein
MRQLLTHLLNIHSGVQPELKMTHQDTVEVLCVVCVLLRKSISEFEFVLYCVAAYRLVYEVLRVACK